jgi:predicted O-methyltransferase YrrM
MPSTFAALPSATDVRTAREAVYAGKRITGRTGQPFDIWPSGMTPDAGDALRRLVHTERASTTIETGFALGLSASFIIEGMLDGGADQPRHTAVDPYQDNAWDDAGLSTAAKLGVAELIRLHREDSILALPRLVAEGHRFEFGFVDGSHLYEHIFCDTLYMTRLIRPGGLIVLDDVWMPATRAALSYFTTNLGLTHENPGDKSAARRFAILRTPPAPPERAWDHFVPFS